MLHLLALFLAAAAPPAGSVIPPGTMIGPDPPPGPMPMENKMLLPGRLPECADAHQTQRAEEEQIKGYTPECLRPLNKDPKPRRN